MKTNNGRYSLILLECEGTSPSWWNREICSHDKILDFWFDSEYRYLYSDQKYQIIDNKTGFVLTSDHFREILQKLL